MTIDELARESGVTTRSVRAYQERGLLPRPTRVGHAGQYDAAHLNRLQLITALLDRGYSLAAIGELLTVWERGGHVSELLGIGEALSRPWSEEAPARFTPNEMEAMFPAGPDELARAIELGLVAMDGDGFVAHSPQLLRAGADLVRAGVPLDAVLDQAEALQANVSAIAKRFVELVVEHVFEPFIAAGMPADDAPRVTALIDKLRPLAAQAVMPALALAMEREVASEVNAAIAALADRTSAAS